MWPRVTIHTKKAEAMITDTNTNSSNVLHLTDPKTQTFWSDNSNAIIKIETWGTNHTQQTIKSISKIKKTETIKSWWKENKETVEMKNKEKDFTF